MNNDKWSVAKGSDNGKPMIVRVNNSIGNLISTGKLNYRAGIAIPLLHPTSDGLPIPEENDIFFSIENDIIDLLKDSRGVLAAIITTSGMKEFMLYLSSDKIDDIIGMLKTKNFNYDIQHYVKEDTDWSGYTSLAGEVNKTDT